ncbi:guanylate cyclase [Trichonephila clavipes]|nr:guanylate cyclase [Trichonephila clavipes]
MRIDKDGGAEGNYTVLSWQPTPDNLKLKMKSGVPPPRYCMLPVGRFYALDNQELSDTMASDVLADATRALQGTNWGSRSAMKESENDVGSLEQLLLHADEHYLAENCPWETI